MRTSSKQRADAAAADDDAAPAHPAKTAATAARIVDLGWIELRPAPECHRGRLPDPGE